MQHQIYQVAESQATKRGFSGKASNMAVLKDVSKQVASSTRREGAASMRLTLPDAPADQPYKAKPHSHMKVCNTCGYKNAQYHQQTR